jgi:hypothetical protein
MAMVIPEGSHGAYREQIVLDARAVVPAPAGATPVEACTLPMNGLTARQSLDLLGLSSGQTLAVTGAAGAYGGYVVQLAKVEGLTVIADASEADHELVASLGADIVVRRGDDVATRILEHFPNGVDGLADGAVLNELVIPRRPRCARTTASSRNSTACGNSWSPEPSPSAWPTPTHRSEPVRHTDGWRPVELEDGSSSSSDPEDQVLTELLTICSSRGVQCQVLKCQMPVLTQPRQNHSGGPRCAPPGQHVHADARCPRPSLTG